MLRRYGIENYLPQHICEAILGRKLTAFFPIPSDVKIDDHFCEPKPLWPKWLNKIRKRKPASFYQKRLNDQAAQHLTMADLKDTDLAEIINAIKQSAEDARQY